eukprot:9047628-Pyramimonas_sp.AAC.1
MRASRHALEACGFSSRIGTRHLMQALTSLQVTLRVSFPILNLAASAGKGSGIPQGHRDLRICLNRAGVQLLHGKAARTALAL